MSMPQVWRRGDPEPGPDVTRVRNTSPMELLWSRVDDGWRLSIWPDEGPLVKWYQVLSLGLVEDATVRPVPLSDHAIGARNPVPRDVLLTRGRIEHDKVCSCDPRYLMSCPRMAAAILAQGGKEPSTDAQPSR